MRSISLISRPSNKITASDAWETGTNVRSAFKHQPAPTHACLMALLKDAIDYLDFNKTITGTRNFVDAVDYLISQFPAMKLEEWSVIMTRLKAGVYGKMYERLKLPELVEIFQQYEGERAEMMERNIKREKDKPPTPLTEEQKGLMKRLLADLKLPEDDTDDRGRWDYIQYPNTPDEDS